MYKEINQLIANAMKNKDEVRLNTLRMIKSAFVKAEKDGAIIDEVMEAKILTKMAAQSEDSISQFENGGRTDLAENEKLQLAIIKEFAPKEVSEEDVIKEWDRMIEDGLEPAMKNMKTFMANIKTIYPTANGKIISDYIKNYPK